MKIGIIGVGVVGSAVNDVFEKNHQVIKYDKYKKGYDSFTKVSKCPVIFICVPTPMNKSGEIHLTAINNSIKEISKKAKNGTIIVIKSTAVSGTTDLLAKTYPQFNFSFNPEFLTEKNPTYDFLHTDRVIVGVKNVGTFNVIKRIYLEAGFKCPIIKTDIKTAEFIKYCSNAFLATKVMFANEMYNICKKLNINYDEVIKSLLVDKRIGKSHWDVPGFDGDKGFGGKCFPKDINALIYLARENDYKPYLLEEVWRSNLSVRKKINWLGEIK